MTLKVNDFSLGKHVVRNSTHLIPGHLYVGKNSKAIYLVASYKGTMTCVSLDSHEVHSAQVVVQGGLLPVSGVLDIKTECCCE